MRELIRKFFNRRVETIPVAVERRCKLTLKDAQQRQREALDRFSAAVNDATRRKVRE